MLFLGFQHGLDVRELAFQLGILGGFDDGRGIADDGAEEFLFGDLFEVGEAEFGEEFLVVAQICFEGGWGWVFESGGGDVGGALGGLGGGDGLAEADDGEGGFLEGADALDHVFYTLRVCHFGGRGGKVEGGGIVYFAINVLGLDLELKLSRTGRSD